MAGGKRRTGAASAAAAGAASGGGAGASGGSSTSRRNASRRRRAEPNRYADDRPEALLTTADGSAAAAAAASGAGAANAAASGTVNPTEPAQNASGAAFNEAAGFTQKGADGALPDGAIAHRVSVLPALRYVRPGYLQSAVDTLKQQQQQQKAKKQQQQPKQRAPAGAFAGVPLVRGADGRLYQPVPTTGGPGGSRRGGGGGGRGPPPPMPPPGYGMMPPPGYGGYGMMPPPGYGMMPPPGAPHHRGPPPPAGGGGAPASSKLFVSNLDANVTESDVRELFLTCGPLREYGVHFDKSGRSQGTAHVVFERREDAAAAVRRYNGVALDGRKMRIEVVEGGGLGARLS